MAGSLRSAKAYRLMLELLLLWLCSVAVAKKKEGTHHLFDKFSFLVGNYYEI